MSQPKRSIDADLASYAVEFSSHPLPPEVIEWAKLALLDWLGCALAGYFSEPTKKVRKVFSQLSGVQESMVLGGGDRVPCTSAAYVNGIMGRALELNDTYTRVGILGHFSEVIPTALAVGEREGSSGLNVLKGIVAGYELMGVTSFHGARLTEGVTPFGSMATPLMAGMLLGLDKSQMLDALGLSVSCNVVLKTWVRSPDGTMPHVKASTFSSTAHHGVLSALMAAEGFTGSHRSVEKFITTLGIEDPAYSLPEPGQFTCFDHTQFKAYACQAHLNGLAEGILTLARDNRIVPREVDGVVIRSSSHLKELSAGEESWRPTTREFADHSAAYVAAIALLEGDVMPAQYERRQWEDPVVLALMDKVEVEVDEAFDERHRVDWSTPIHIRISTGGSINETMIDYPKGHPKNPMTMADVERKFRRLVGAYLDEESQNRVIENVMRLDAEATLAPLLDTLVF